MNTKKLLGLFNIRSIEANLFEELLKGGVQSATELARHASVSRTAVYDLVKKLIVAGLVSETQSNGIKKYTVQPPEKIQLLIEEKEVNVREAKKQVFEFKEIFEQKQTSAKPRLLMFEGRAELQQMMKDLLLYRDITVVAYWPVKKMLELLTPEFMNNFHHERMARNITLRVIWPATQALTAGQYKFLNSNAALKREARIAPKDTEFTLGYSVYGHTVRFISSSKENFGFLVESAELADMMRSQFEILWKISKSTTLKKN